ncbi:MAG: hypothetical protein HETSPECPRED_001912 [Heterodermia speciosa]|uniref:Uncharacterized protein n=1 Tax=Heterodermia speciosa TaxID=116794 RepID=A0A8H3PGI3_9LECA|nr:MAG: hypothetical protein HETSPECPRED_001912 [Heterodermia speciosa]
MKREMLAAPLAALRPTIEAIRKAPGCPGPTPGHPLQQAQMLFLKAHIPFSTEPSDRGQSYCLARAHTLLPASTGPIGLIPSYVPTMPTIGKGLQKPVLCLWHQGSSNLFLLPEQQTAIALLTNAMANNDAVDWIGQLILETVLDVSQPDDYLVFAKLNARNTDAL